LLPAFAYDALKNGYKVYFGTMEQINETLIMKDIIRTTLIEYNKLLKVHLLVIDDIMMLVLEKK
jgi:DNA replication protein DnaC